MNGKRPSLRFTAAAALVLAACGPRGEVRRGSQATVRDSAGVQIVEHAADLPASLPEWPVDTVPLVDIGGGDDPEQDLDNVRGATRLGDGRIVVANTGSGELRIYDGKGKWLRNLGRKGEGPGE
ncbi:MAG TPA: hypothetical protein VF187_06275, partial [Gemmatimonadales bacterium]